MSEDDLTTIKFQRTGLREAGPRTRIRRSDEDGWLPSARDTRNTSFRTGGSTGERAGSMAGIEADGPLHDVHSTLGLRLECKAPYARNISLSATSRPVLETESGAVATVELPAYEFNHVE